MGRIAGIDFGKARIGLAISDERKVIATPLETISASSHLPQNARLIAHALLNYKNLEAIVIGLPLLLNGKEGEMALLVRSFAKILEELIPVPILFWDERLTSLGVERMLLDANISREKRRLLSDALSAVSILQNYLDSLSYRKG